jgi:chromosome segregation ATPase
MHKLDDIISLLLLDLFRSVKDTPGEALIEKRHRVELTLAKSKLKAARADLAKLTSDLSTYQSEVIKAIQGKSKFDADILNDLIKQTKNKIAEAQNEANQHETELENKQQHMTDIQSQYQNLITWADIFEDSNHETKKMITAYLIESVKVTHDYNVEIKFHVAYEHFAGANGLTSHKNDNITEGGDISA